MTTQATASCGYGGHTCQRESVQFISRYRDQSDYCVRGQRIGICDDGTIRSINPVTEQHIEWLRCYRLTMYRMYLDWRRQQRAKDSRFNPELQSFEFPPDAARA